MRPRLAAATASVGLLLLTATPALACGGLIGPNGAVNLLRTTTLAGYHDGVEHYVTAFEFAGGGGAFGRSSRCPASRRKVERGGDWTLQRLVRETDPRARGGRFARRRRRRRRARRGPLAGRGSTPSTSRSCAAAARTSAVGHGARLPAPARRARGARLLRQAFADLPGRHVRCRCRGQKRGQSDRRRHAGPPHHPDRQPVGAAAHPRPRQDGRRTGSRPTSTC